MHQKYGEESTEKGAVIFWHVECVVSFPIKNDAIHNKYHGHLHGERYHDSLNRIAQIILRQVHFLSARFMQRSIQHRVRIILHVNACVIFDQVLPFTCQIHLLKFFIEPFRDAPFFHHHKVHHQDSTHEELENDRHVD